MAYQVFLKKKEDGRIRAGHAWVYANEVQEIRGDGKNGDLAEVFDCHGAFLGKGYINHLSKILVRLFIRDRAGTDDQALFTERVRAAHDARTSLGLTEAYRVVFDQADDLPGVVIDRYGDLVSLQIHSLGMDRNRDKIVTAIREVLAPRGIYERSDAPVRAREGLPPVSGPVGGAFDPVTSFRENGLLFRTDLANGQKTGYFLDQRENRLAVRRYCTGGSVLDCFCNAGGFSMNAAFAGAERILALDASESALEDVKANAALNGFTNIETVRGDAFTLLRGFHREGRQFHTVILDPPAFCKSIDQVRDALRGYRDVNLLGMKLTQPGGYLVTASCSRFVTQTLFRKMLREAAAASGRRVRLLETKAQASDHPVLLAADENEYLKFYVLQIM
ncbi:MAG: class I SAM-dependent rRNA methyltransferase [Clostridia bacterium]|nr:class I SAM-dependent rRNA methyltransferase [Clostridia bacterium]